jgi:hypothetical protein
LKVFWSGTQLYSERYTKLTLFKGGMSHNSDRSLHSNNLSTVELHGREPIRVAVGIKMSVTFYILYDVFNLF